MNPTWLHVLAIYAIAVWIARRGGIDLPWRVAAFFYALVLVFLFRPMTQDFVNVPVDFLQSLPPWAHLVRHHRNWNGALNDIPQQMLPWAHQVREAWKSFELPLWNARSGSGYPLLANGQSAALSPLRLLALPLSLGNSFTAEAAMKLLVALTFTYLLGRRRHYSELASAIGAVGFGFCSFLTVWLHFPHTTVAAFLPAVIYAVDLLAEERTYRRFVLAALIWVVLLFGGHPETAAHIFSLALLLVIWILAVERPFANGREVVGFISALCGAMLVAALLASPLLAPLFEAIPKSLRYQQVQVNPPDPHPFRDFQSQILLLQPHFYGDIPVEPSFGPGTAESITGFAGILGVVGWLALLFSAIGERRFRTREMFLVAATPIVLGVVLGWPVIGTVFHAALSMAANARMRLVLAFVVALQGAAVADMIERRRGRPVLMALAIVTVVLLSMMTLIGFPAPWLRDVALLGMLPSIAVIAIAAIALLIPQRWRFASSMVLLTAVIAEVWAVGINWNATLPSRLMYPRTPLIAKLEQLRDSAPPASFRIVGVGPVLFPNVSAVYGFDDIRFHDPMANGRYAGMMRLLAGYTVEDYFAMWRDVDTRVLDYLNVRYVVAMPRTEMEDMQRFALVYDGKDGRIFENRDVLPRFHTTPGVVLEFKPDEFVGRILHNTDWANTVILRNLKVENDKERTDLLAPRPAGSPEAKLRMISSSDTEYRMTVDAPRYSYVVSSIPWWPGWKVERNGEAIEATQANGTFVGFVVRPGKTEVRVYFSPRTFNYSAIASLLTAALLAALSRESLRRRVPVLRRLG